MTMKWVYQFSEGNKDMRDLLGGKGAGVAEMTRASLPVPPGFTITTEACNEYFKAGQKFPEGMWDQAMAALKSVEAQTGKQFGDAANPLLVSVRSGAKFSMPGMMDTVLNLGLNDTSIQGLIAQTGNERFAWDSYRRFVQMYGDVVLDLKPKSKDDIDPFEEIIEAKKRARGVHFDTDLTANDLSINQVPPGAMGPGDAQAHRPFPQFSNVFLINPAVGNSTYHAGFARLERRYSSGISFLAHYTFSKFIDDVASSDEYGDPVSYMDAYNRRLDKSLSGTDVPHRLVVSGLFEVPYFKYHRVLRAALGGWKVGALATMQSGPLFTVNTAANTTNAFPAGPLRPDMTADPRLPTSSRTLLEWFNTPAFRQPELFRFGNSPRSGLRGDSLRTVDVTIAKEFAVTERFRTDVRGEFYNLLNHANFELPGHTFGNADFGTVLSARPSRTVQLGLRLSF